MSGVFSVVDMQITGKSQQQLREGVRDMQGGREGERESVFTGKRMREGASE